MSDIGRKNLSTKLEEHVVPDSTKSTQQKISESVTGTADKFVRGVQPDSEKSLSQETADKVGRSKDQHVHGGTGESVLDKTKNALGLNNH